MSTWTIIGPTAPFKGGITEHTTELARRLSAAAANVTVESWRRQYPKRLYPGVQAFAHHEKVDPCRVLRRLSWNNPLSWVALGWRLRRRSGRVVVSAVTPFQFPIYLTVLLIAGRPVRTTATIIAHNVSPHEASPLDRLLTRSLYRSVGRVVTHSPTECRRAIELGADAREALLPFHFDSPPRAAPSESLHFRIAFVGFVRPYKGLDLLIEALARTRTKIELEVVGEFWDPVKKYEQLAKIFGVTNQCEFRPGYASDIAVVDLLDRSDALVLPYRSATASQLPRVAFQRKVPVIATDTGDFSRQVRHGVDGLICESVSVDAITAALDRFYSNGLASSLARATQPPDADAEWGNYLSKIGLNGPLSSPG